MQITGIRIVTDEYKGYEAQRYILIAPFICWQYGGSNTFSNVDEAKKYINRVSFVEYITVKR